MFTARKERPLSTNLYVGNLPFNTSAEQLEALFSQHGAVVRAQVISDRETGRSRGFGFVEMENDSSAQAAISALNGADYNGRRLNVNVARERSR
ncbi:MAG: RNA-binding protein [Actinobacteria bacterium]|nr:RNA-binding protein [Actinomycetota bacterium]